ncbi:MAG: glycogen-binding domain-containing protein [Candidatus Omnitrophica bacterium]|jgi:1,4-alpha-glucan branching enzyme|nr:glycogen-binding domain-containing protein [Candidatus Omnitrophota bacterium]
MVKTMRSKTVEFKLYAPSAKCVSLAGNFNNWDTGSIKAKKGIKGSWMIKKSLKPGRYEYKFFVDGNWVNDPSSSNIANSFGTQNSIIEVK